MNVLRILLIATISFFPRFALGQHVALHWYAFQSLLPLNAAEGKEALVVIREHTSDSLSSFTDKSDIFSVACKEDENLDNLADVMNEFGFYLVDITNPRLENSYYVRLTKGYQYAILCWAEPEKFQSVGVSGVVINSAVKSMLNPEQKAIVESNPAFILKQE